MTALPAGPAEPNLAVSAAAAELRTDGMTILRDVVPAPAVRELSVAVEEERRYLARTDPVGLARTSPVLGSPAHTGFLCPFREPFASSAMLSCAPLIEVSTAYLGGPLYLHEVVVNFALAGRDSAQTPHMDQSPEPGGPVGVVWNVAISRVGPDNGMTALYPGSHHGSEERMPDRPVQPELDPGDVLIRDLSLVHHGVANPSAADRALLAFVVKPPWQQLPAEFVSPVAPRAWESYGPPDGLLRRHRRAEGDEPQRARAYPIPDELR